MFSNCKLYWLRSLGPWILCKAIDIILFCVSIGVCMLFIFLFIFILLSLKHWSAKTLHAWIRYITCEKTKCRHCGQMWIISEFKTTSHQIGSDFLCCLSNCISLQVVKTLGWCSLYSSYSLFSNPFSIYASVCRAQPFCFMLSDADILVVMVTNEAQAESILYGDLGAVSGKVQCLFYLSWAVLTSFVFFCSPSIWSIYHSFIHCFSCLCQSARATLTKYVLLVTL